MKIAVLIYGRLNKCVEHYNNIIENIGKDNEIDFFLSSDNSDKSLLNDFISLYKPILYNNDKIYYNFDFTKYEKRFEVNTDNMICHFMNKDRVFKLFQEYIIINNIQYDCVISLRIDCIFRNNFNFNNLLDNTIYIPNGFDFINLGINDQIAYGKIDAIKKYSSIYSNLLYILDNKLSIIHPESINYANIHLNKLLIERINLQYDIDK